MCSAPANSRNDSITFSSAVLKSMLSMKPRMVTLKCAPGSTASASATTAEATAPVKVRAMVWGSLKVRWFR